MLIFKSMAILQKEKLVVIKKELLHLWHISDFYKSKEISNQNTTKENGGQRETISKKIYADIRAHIKYIKQLNEDIDNYYAKFGKREDEYLDFLTMYDCYNEKIKDLLSVVQLIQAKFLQFQQEHFNQYMPVPNINKRYSSKGFLDYLKEYHTEILRGEHPDIEHPITLWGRTDSFRANSSLGIRSEAKERYVEIPYWNYEIPFMLPIITHEMGHIVLDDIAEKSNAETQLTILKDIFKNSDKVKDIFKDSDSFLDEILADIFAYIHHGEAYIASVSHELLGQGFSKQFYSQDKNNPSSIQPIDMEEPRFFEPLIRLKVLVMLTILNYEEPTEFTKNLEKILDWLIIDIGEKVNIEDKLKEVEKTDIKNSLGKIYHVYYGLTHEYINFYDKVMPCISAIGQAMEENLNPIGLAIQRFNTRVNESEGLKLYMDVFNELAEDRIKLLNDNVDFQETKIEFKNKMRKLILEKEKALNINDKSELGSAYELVMFKTRMDGFRYPDEEGQVAHKNYIEMLSDEIRDRHNTILINKESNEGLLRKDNQIEPKFTFDYNSMLALVKKRESITIKEMNRYLSFEPKEKITKYYANKYSLILLEEEKEKVPKANKGYFSAFINLSLEHNNSEKTRLAKELLMSEMENSFGDINYEIFKSLGPKEIVIHLNNCSIDAIYAAKKNFFKIMKNYFIEVIQSSALILRI